MFASNDEHVNSVNEDTLSDSENLLINRNVDEEIVTSDANKNSERSLDDLHCSESVLRR